MRGVRVRGREIEKPQKPQSSKRVHCVHIKETEMKKRETSREIQRVTERHLCKLALYIVLSTLPCFFVSLLLAELWRRSVHVSIFYRLMPNSPYTNLHWDVQYIMFNTSLHAKKKKTSSLSHVVWRYSHHPVFFTFNSHPCMYHFLDLICFLMSQ